MPDDVRLIRSRRAAREAILQALYQLEVSGCSVDDAVRDMFDRQAYAHEIVEYMRETVRGIGREVVTLDETIIPFLNRGWDWSRLAVTDKSALRLAAYELWFLPGIPPKVTISEAVAIAKKFGSEQSSGFVNGLLANLLKASPKANWVPPAEPDVDWEEPPEPEEIPEEELVQEGSAAHEAMVTAGAWVVRKPEAQGATD
jgi:N utilization substance protein B